MAEIASAMDPIQVIRASNRMNLSAQRSKDREDLLKQRRVSLVEAEALVTDISLAQFKELCLKVKNKKTTFDVLRAVKNSCFSPGRTEAFMKTENALNSLVRFLVGRDGQMQLESAACLANLACGSHRASHRIAKTCGPYLVSFLCGGSPYLQDQCAWACGNMAHCCFQCFSLLKAQGLVPALLANIQSPVPDVIRSTMFALNACTKYEDEDLRDLASDPTTTNSLLKLLDRENLDERAQSDALFALSNILCLLAKSSVEISISSVETILTHLEKSILKDDIDIKLALPLVRCLGFASKTEYTCLYLVQQPKFKTIVDRILNSNCLHLFREIIWVLTNIIGSCDPTTVDANLNVIFRNIHSNKSNHMLVAQVLYFLCSWASRNKNIRIQLIQEEYSSTIEELASCGERTLEKGSQVLQNIITS